MLQQILADQPGNPAVLLELGTSGRETWGWADAAHGGGTDCRAGFDLAA